MKTTVISLLLLALLSGCVSQNNKSVRAPSVRAPSVRAPIVHKQTAQNVTQSIPPRAPKKHIKLKEVDDNNFNDKYMYPEDRVKKETAEQPKVVKPIIVKPAIAQSTTEMSTEKVSTVEQPAIPSLQQEP